jgi:putative membrane protein
MRLIAILAAAAAMLAAEPAAAQLGNPAGVEAGSGKGGPGTPAPHETNNADRLFAQLAVTGGRAEVELARLAQQKGADAGVKDFAQMMIDDHGPANDKLAGLAKTAGIPLPSKLDPDHEAMRKHLEQLSGHDFDVDYTLAQIQDHQRTATLLEWEINSGQDAPLQKFAADTLPVVLGHLRSAQMLASKLTGQAPPEIERRVSSADEGKPAPHR